MTGNVATPRAMLAADPREMVRTLRALILACDEERARLAKELREWELAAGKRPDDGSDQGTLFDARAQPTLW